MNKNSQLLTYPMESPPEFGTPVPVAEQIWWMRLPLPMALDHVNVFILEDPEGLTIVDTGFDTKKTRAMWETALRENFAGKKIIRVLATHHHPDHIGLAGWFQKDFDAELVTTRTAWLFARMLTLDEQDRPTPETVSFFRSGGMDPDVLEKRTNERPFNFSDIVAPMPLGFKRIKEGDSLSAGGRHWHVRIGNGHAPEHATLWDTSGELVLGGDQLLPSISPNLGLYATEPEADPVADWLEACERLRAFATPQQLVLPGHKLPFRGLPVRLRQLIDNHHGALDRLSQFLEQPHTAADCFEVLFKRKIGASEYGLAMVEAMAHVQHLYLADKVTRHQREDGAWLWQRRH